MFRHAVFSLAGLVVLAGSLCAQTGVGQIQGTVKDATGAVLPGAPVGLERVQTENKFLTTTSGIGFFVFPSLPAGEYRLTVTMPGMQKWEGQVLLRVGQQAVVDPTLQVERAAEQVTVVGDVTPLVTTDRKSVV